MLDTDTRPYAHLSDDSLNHMIEFMHELITDGNTRAEQRLGQLVTETRWRLLVADVDQAHTEALTEDAGLRDAHEGWYDKHDLPFGPQCADSDGVIWEHHGNDCYALLGLPGQPIPAPELEEHGPFVAVD